MSDKPIPPDVVCDACGSRENLRRDNLAPGEGGFIVYVCSKYPHCDIPGPLVHRAAEAIENVLYGVEPLQPDDWKAEARAALAAVLPPFLALAEAAEQVKRDLPLVWGEDGVVLHALWNALADVRAAFVDAPSLFGGTRG